MRHPPRSAQGRQVEVTAVFLDHHVGRDLRGAEQRVLGLVDRERLWNALLVGRVGVIPARVELGQLDRVWGVAINLVCAHVHEGRLRARLPRGFEEVERADGVGVEIVERDRRGAVVRGLGRGVDDDRRLDGLDQRQDAGAVADVELVVDEARQLLREALLVPAGVTLRPEEDRPLVVVHAVDGVAQGGEINADFRADEARGTGDEDGLGHDEKREVRQTRSPTRFQTNLAWRTRLHGAPARRPQRPKRPRPRRPA